MNRIKGRWNGPRITFAFLDCPACNQKLEAPHCPFLEEELREPRQLYDIVLAKALERAAVEGIDKDEELKNQNSIFFNNLKAYSMHELAFFMCFKCKQPYYGGRRACGGNQNFKPEDLICGSCVALRLGAGVADCQKHGKDFIEFKCRYCCKIALWFCFGSTHFCDNCHQVADGSRA